MRKNSSRFVALCSLVLLFAVFELCLNAQPFGSLEAAAQSSAIPAPADVLGFTPGDDRKLASWAKTIEYFQKLDAASDRVMFEELGKTTMGAPFVMATISAPENLKRLNDYKRIQAFLADPRKLGPPGLRDRKAAQQIALGKTVVLITCGIHSDEVGSTLSSMLIAHRLASSNDPEIQNILQNTIVLLVPSLNPDGVDIVKNWYDSTVGTPYEGADEPMLYNKFVGHDDNRDWYAFTQIETQIAVDKIHNTWHPHIVHDIHQQAARGSRLFLPPYMEPVEPNVPKQIVAGYTELGRAMAANLRAAGFKGITTDSTYDAWTPARAYSHYHGGVRILSETASAKVATPISIKFEELTSREGYDPKKESAKFGPLWNGGEWRLRDITNYMTAAAFALLKHAAENRARWLERFYEIGREAVRPRTRGELAAFVIPPSKNRQTILDILERAGVEVFFPRSFAPRDPDFVPGTAVVPIAQPYGSFAAALLQRQHYPNLRDSSGHPIAPYDVTAHTLPLLMDVEARAMFSPFTYSLFPRGSVLSAAPIMETKLVDAGVGIYKSNVASMDEGWTRWAFEDYSTVESGTPYFKARLAYRTLTDREVRNGKLGTKYKTIILPDQARATILNGHRPDAMPPEYVGGLGKDGVNALREFVSQGGTLICFNRASEFAIEQFKLPLRNVVAGLPRTDFFVPGSILRIELDTSNPIAKGMPRESIAWLENSPVFEVIDEVAGKRSEPPVKVIGWYPKDKDPLLSGWLLGGERVKGKAALVEVTMGKGRIILFGFRPQYRGQSLATYPLLFNALR